MAFNAQVFRITVQRITDAIEMLYSVHAADAGGVINPMQYRGQVEGAVVRGVGWATTEELAFTNEGRIVNPPLRNFHVPALADAPRTDVLSACTHDALGPWGATVMGECQTNPIAPALANAIADATGFRVHALPSTLTRIYRPVF